MVIERSHLYNHDHEGLMLIYSEFLPKCNIPVT